MNWRLVYSTVWLMASQQSPLLLITVNPEMPEAKTKISRRQAETIHTNFFFVPPRIDVERKNTNIMNLGTYCTIFIITIPSLKLASLILAPTTNLIRPYILCRDPHGHHAAMSPTARCRVSQVQSEGTKSTRTPSSFLSAKTKLFFRVDENLELNF